MARRIARVLLAVVGGRAGGRDRGGRRARRHQPRAEPAGGRCVAEPDAGGNHSAPGDAEPLGRARQPDRHHAPGGLHGLPQDTGQRGERPADRPPAGGLGELHVVPRQRPAREDGARPLGNPRGPVPRVPHGNHAGGRGSPALPRRELEVPLVPRLARPAAGQHEGPLRGHLLPVPPGDVASRAGLPAPAPGRRHVPHLPRRRRRWGRSPRTTPRAPTSSARRATCASPDQPRVAPHDLKAYDGDVRRSATARPASRTDPRRLPIARLRSVPARRAALRDGPVVLHATGHRDRGRRRMALRCPPRRRRIVVPASRASMSDALRHGTRSR